MSTLEPAPESGTLLGSRSSPGRGGRDAATAVEAVKLNVALTWISACAWTPTVGLSPPSRRLRVDGQLDQVLPVALEVDVQRRERRLHDRLGRLLRRDLEAHARLVQEVDRARVARLRQVEVAHHERDRHVARVAGEVDARLRGLALQRPPGEGARDRLVARRRLEEHHGGGAAERGRGGARRGRRGGRALVAVLLDRLLARRPGRGHAGVEGSGASSGTRSQSVIRWSRTRNAVRAVCPAPAPHEPRPGRSVRRNVA